MICINSNNKQSKLTELITMRGTHIKNTGCNKKPAGGKYKCKLLKIKHLNIQDIIFQENTIEF